MTRKQVYNLLPAPIRDRALKNTEKTLLKLEVETLSDSILQGFFWDKTTEGDAYWRSIYNILDEAEDKLNTYV